MKIFIIGAGNMGGAIAKALAKPGAKVYVADNNPQKLAALKKQAKIIVDSNFRNLSAADFVIVAVKPQDLGSVRLAFNPKSILVSIAAGVKIEKLQRIFHHQKVVRVMPNLGLSVGLGIAAWKSSGLSKKEKASSQKFLSQFTENFEVQKESDIDSVTAISGSGPAYFFYLAQSLHKAALALGFNKVKARALVAKTFSAAAQLQSDVEYGELINRVRSKKGTTDAALKIFDKHHMMGIIKAGVIAGRKRAEELSNG